MSEAAECLQEAVRRIWPVTDALVVLDAELVSVEWMPGQAVTIAASACTSVDDVHAELLRRMSAGELG